MLEKFMKGSLISEQVVNTKSATRQKNQFPKRTDKKCKLA